MTPREYTSDRESTAAEPPAACSGLMYSSVPITDPNAANLFFSHGPTVGAFALAGSLPIAAWAMHAGSVAWMLRPEALRRASREFA